MGNTAWQYRVSAVLIRLVALVVLFAGVTKFVDVGLPPEAQIHYEPWKLAAIGSVEILLAAWALWRPKRLPALLLTGFLVVVTVYLLLIPPGELERAGCSCFGSRFRFQDVRMHIRFNGVLILLGVAGAVLGRGSQAGGAALRRLAGQGTARLRRLDVGAALIRLVALVVLGTGAHQLIDQMVEADRSGGMTGASIVEVAVGAMAIWRPTAIAVTLLVAVIVALASMLILVPPGRLDADAVGILGVRDASDQIRIFGALALAAAVGVALRWQASRRAARR